MAVDAVVLREELRLHDECLIAHLSELNEYDIQDRACHIHCQCRY